MFEIKSVADLSDRNLCAAMNDAFSDYVVPLQLTQEGFDQMMRQRGLTGATSFAAFDGGEIAAIWLTSARQGRAYLISSGTRPEFRSKGAARQLADACLLKLKSLNITSFQTEVMDQNEVAASLYFKLGMIVSRHLDCFDIPVPADPAAPSHNVGLAHWQDISDQAAELRSWEPTWQNSDQSLEAVADTLVCVQVRDQEGLAGYAAVLPATATIAQIAVRLDLRRQKLGSNMIAYLQRKFPDRKLRVINAQADDQAFSGFMSSIIANRTVGQRELFMPV